MRTMQAPVKAEDAPGLRLPENAARLRRGRISALGGRTFPASHPIVRRVPGETLGTHRPTERLHRRGSPASGLTDAVVPRGEETVRFQINADHTPEDLNLVPAALSDVRC